MDRVVPEAAPVAEAPKEKAEELKSISWQEVSKQYVILSAFQSKIAQMVSGQHKSPGEVRKDADHLTMDACVYSPLPLATSPPAFSVRTALGFLLQE